MLLPEVLVRIRFVLSWTKRFYSSDELFFLLTWAQKAERKGERISNVGVRLPL